MDTKICSICGEEIVKPDHGGSGYGTNDKDEIICYECCGVLDTLRMKDDNQAILYLDQDQENNYFVSNWPGTLKIMVDYCKKGKHNIAGSRYDVWFTFVGKNWHGVQYGEFTQICHCKVVK